jgi:tetratricopeptide (TPR) repeat protein
MGKFDEAIGYYQRAIKLRRDFAKPHSNLGYVLMSQGNFDRALEHFNRALKIQSDYSSPLAGLAWILATHPDLKKRDTNLAVELAQRAAELTANKNAMVLNTLAVAYAAAGQADLAVEYYRKATNINSNIRPSKDLEAILKRHKVKKTINKP